jgi:hypothetical protein
MGVTGLIVAITSLTLPPQCEDDQRIADLDQSTSNKIERNMNEIVEALKMPAIYRVLGYFLLGGLVTPGFG